MTFVPDEEAEKALQAAMDSGDTRVKHLEKMLARAKQIHDEALAGTGASE